MKPNKHIVGTPVRCAVGCGGENAGKRNVLGGASLAPPYPIDRLRPFPSSSGRKCATNFPRCAACLDANTWQWMFSLMRAGPNVGLE